MGERLRDEHSFAGGQIIVKVYVRELRHRLREMFVPPSPLSAITPTLARQCLGDTTVRSSKDGAVYQTEKPIFRFMTKIR